MHACHNRSYTAEIETNMSPNKREERKKRAHQIIRELKKLHPHAGMILQYSNNWELLVAVILSAQCTDKKVNEVTKKLFKKYQTLDDYVHANKKEFEKDIFQTGFYKNKTKHILAAAQIIKKEFKGNLPQTIADMIRIPGVARKTANVVLGNAFGIIEGIAVDTHVKRFAITHDLTDQIDPKKIEQDLMKIIPQKEWFDFTYLAIEYGRTYCPARKHAHENCPLTKFAA